MFNAEIPTRAELPSSAKLLKSTLLALVAAAILLVTVVLPAEHGIDPTGIGRKLGLAQMGEIKEQLAHEAEKDRQMDQNKPAAPPDKRSSLGGWLARLIVSNAHAGERTLLAQAARSDELTIALKPGQGIEYKLEMKKSAKVEYEWVVEGGAVNYDLHGTPGSGKETSYKKDRGAKGDKGTLEAAYDGAHGWYWRNRGSEPVTIKLKVKGEYSGIKQTA